MAATDPATIATALRWASTVVDLHDLEVDVRSHVRRVDDPGIELSLIGMSARQLRDVAADIGGEVEHVARSRTVTRRWLNLYEMRCKHLGFWITASAADYEDEPT